MDTGYLKQTKRPMKCMHLCSNQRQMIDCSGAKDPVGWLIAFQEVDDVLGGSAAWDNVDSTEERCPKCSHPRAYFMQIQTRSADEPMTTFYKCCSYSCGHRWRD